VSIFVYGTHVNVPELVVKGGATYRIVHDHLGSPRLLIDQSTGAVIQRMDYDEWGQIVLDTNPGFQPFGFAGGTYDNQTGLTWFGARGYEPVLGRWLTKDAVGFAAPGWNLYDYILGDPINSFEPSGLCPACRPCDECPSGTWSYFGGSGSLFIGIGVTWTQGTFTCVGKESVQVPVRGGCFGAGFILAAGFGAEGSGGFNFAKACNSGDLLGQGRGIHATLGPISATSTWNYGGNFTGTNLGSSKSLGMGAAYIDCYLSRR
jgi:RHS repeat-associated protein